MTDLQESITSVNVLLKQFEASNNQDEKDKFVRCLTLINDSIIAAPVTNIFDVRAKAQHLLEMLETGGDPLDDDCMLPLLRSLAGSAA